MEFGKIPDGNTRPRLTSAELAAAAGVPVDQVQSFLDQYAEFFPWATGPEDAVYTQESVVLLRYIHTQDTKGKPIAQIRQGVEVLHEAGVSEVLDGQVHAAAAPSMPAGASEAMVQAVAEAVQASLAPLLQEMTRQLQQLTSTLERTAAVAPEAAPPPAPPAPPTPPEEASGVAPEAVGLAAAAAAPVVAGMFADAGEDAAAMDVADIEDLEAVLDEPLEAVVQDEAEEIAEVEAVDALGAEIADEGVMEDAILEAEPEVLDASTEAAVDAALSGRSMSETGEFIFDEGPISDASVLTEMLPSEEAPAAEVEEEVAEDAVELDAIAELDEAALLDEVAELDAAAVVDEVVDAEEDAAASMSLSQSFDIPEEVSLTTSGAPAPELEDLDKTMLLDASLLVPEAPAAEAEEDVEDAVDEAAEEATDEAAAAADDEAADEAGDEATDEATDAAHDGTDIAAQPEAEVMDDEALLEEDEDLFEEDLGDESVLGLDEAASIIDADEAATGEAPDEELAVAVEPMHETWDMESSAEMAGAPADDAQDDAVSDDAAATVEVVDDFSADVIDDEPLDMLEDDELLGEDEPTVSAATDVPDEEEADISDADAADLANALQATFEEDEAPAEAAAEDEEPEEEPASSAVDAFEEKVEVIETDDASAFAMESDTLEMSATTVFNGDVSELFDAEGESEQDVAGVEVVDLSDSGKELAMEADAEADSVEAPVDGLDSEEDAVEAEELPLEAASDETTSGDETSGSEEHWEFIMPGDSESQSSIQLDASDDRSRTVEAWNFELPGLDSANAAEPWSFDLPPIDSSGSPMSPEAVAAAESQDAGDASLEQTAKGLEIESDDEAGESFSAEETAREIQDSSVQSVVSGSVITSHVESHAEVEMEADAVTEDASEPPAPPEEEAGFSMDATMEMTPEMLASIAATQEHGVTPPPAPVEPPPVPENAPLEFEKDEAEAAPQEEGKGLIVLDGAGESSSSRSSIEFNEYNEPSEPPRTAKETRRVIWYMHKRNCPLTQIADYLSLERVPNFSGRASWDVGDVEAVVKKIDAKLKVRKQQMQKESSSAMNELIG